MLVRLVQYKSTFASTSVVIVHAYRYYRYSSPTSQCLGQSLVLKGTDGCVRELWGT
jgi:hypothetical protein